MEGNKEQEGTLPLLNPFYAIIFAATAGAALFITEPILYLPLLVTLVTAVKFWLYFTRFMVLHREDIWGEIWTLALVLVLFISVVSIVKVPQCWFFFFALVYLINYGKCRYTAHLEKRKPLREHFKKWANNTWYYIGLGLLGGILVHFLQSYQVLIYTVLCVAICLLSIYRLIRIQSNQAQLLEKLKETKAIK